MRKFGFFDINGLKKARTRHKQDFGLTGLTSFPGYRSTALIVMIWFDDV
jgi:hypothetical protein